MRTSRRGLFGLVAGVVGVAVFGKEAKPERLVIGRGSTKTTVFSNQPVTDAGFQSSATSMYTASSITWSPVKGQPGVWRADLYYTDFPDLPKDS